MAHLWFQSKLPELEAIMHARDVDMESVEQTGGVPAVPNRRQPAQRPKPIPSVRPQNRVIHSKRERKDPQGPPPGINQRGPRGAPPGQEPPGMGYGNDDDEPERKVPSRSPPGLTQNMESVEQTRETPARMPPPNLSRPNRKQEMKVSSVTDKSKCPIAIACKFGKSRDCPFDDAEISGYYKMAGGTSKDPALIIDDMRYGKTPAGGSTCGILTKLLRSKGTLLDYVPPKDQVVNMIPSAYLQFLKTDPGATESQKFRRAVHLDNIAKAQICLDDSKTSLNDIIKLTTEQDFLRHYMVPYPELPGLLLALSAGAGKTAAAIAIATSSWVFQGFQVSWVTKTQLVPQYTRDALNLMAHAVIAELAKGDETGQMTTKFRTMKDPEQRKATLSQDKNFVNPITYDRFKNAYTRFTKTTKEARQLAMPMRKTVIVIDEAHEFLASIGESGWEEFKSALDECRSPSIPIHEQVRIIAVTATPTYESPLTLFKLLYMVGGQWQLDKYKSQIDARFKSLPLTGSSLNLWLNPDSRILLPQARQALELAGTGLISYISIVNDPTRFPQINSDTWVRVHVSDIQGLKIEGGEEEPSGKRRGKGKGKIPKKDADENFATYDAEYMADSVGFLDRAGAILEEMKYLSPKFSALVTRILDQDQVTSETEHFKHVIYTENGITAKMVWSLLIANGFSSALNQSGIVESNGPHAVMFLSKTNVPVFSHKIGELVDRSLEIFNSKANAHGAKIRVLVIDSTLMSGIDLKDVRFLHILEPTSTTGILLDILNQTGSTFGERTIAYKTFARELAQEKTNILQKELGGQIMGKRRGDGDNVAPLDDMVLYELKQDFDQVSKQIIGRVTRACGSPNLSFGEKGWLLDVTRYYALARYGDTDENDGVTVYEQMLKKNPEGNIDISGLLLNMQLQNILLGITLDRDMPPEGIPVSRPHPKLGHLIQASLNASADDDATMPE